MKPKTILIIFMIIFMIPFSSALKNYTQLGGSNLFNLGDGEWNEHKEVFSSSARVITTVSNPFVADMDDDGINEIIVLDGDTLMFYQNSSLDILDSFNIGLNDTDELSNQIIFDIDGDSRPEFIVVDEELEIIFIIGYNGTAVTLDSNVSLSSITHINTSFAPAGETLIGCEFPNRCIIVYGEQGGVTGGGQPNQLSAIAFNSTSVIGTETILDVGGAGDFRGYCFSKIRTLTNQDVDNDGVDEYVPIVVRGRDGDDPLILGFTLSLNDSDAVINEGSFSDTKLFSFGTGTWTCENETVENYFTSAYVEDIDGGVSNGKETVFGVMVSADTYKMFSYKSDRTFLDDYPEFQTGEGIIISNIFKANAYTDTGLVDFCLAGFKNLSNELDVTCASEQTGDIVETTEFILDTSNLYNITQTFHELDILTHSGNHKIAVTRGNDLSEIINTFGVSELSYTGGLCELSKICEMNLLWQNPKGTSTIITADVQKNGKDDILTTTRTNIWYFDDNFVTSPAEIDYYYINPCLDSTWKQNTTVEARFSVIDADSDDVSARAILYAPSTPQIPNQEWGWTGNSFIPSDAITSGRGLTWNGEAWYIVHNEKVHQYDSLLNFIQGFNVSNQTNNFNDIYYEGITDRFYLLGQNDFVYEYDHFQSGHNFSNLSQVDLTESTSMEGLFLLNDSWYVVAGGSDDSVFKYNRTFGYTGTVIDLSSYVGNPRDIYFKDSEWYIVDDTTDTVFEFDSSWNFLDSFPLGQDNSNRGIWAREDEELWYVFGQDSDTVYTYYFGEEALGNFQDSGWTINQPSGTTFPFSFIASNITPSSILRLLARDTSDPNDIDQIDLTFSVAGVGVEFGNCNTQVDVITSLEELNISNVTDVISEAELRDLRDETLNMLNIPTRFAFLLGVFLIIISVWSTIVLLAENGVKDGMVLMYLPMVIGLVVWIMTVSFRLIPAWTVMVGILFAFAFIGFRVYSNRNTAGL